jgi:pyruvate,orthophosphate dikinase
VAARPADHWKIEKAKPGMAQKRTTTKTGIDGVTPRMVQKTKILPKTRVAAKGTSSRRGAASDKPSTRRASAVKYVYSFGGGTADGNRSMKDLLGGKGAGLAEMTNAGLPVPPGFTVTTEACNLYHMNRSTLPAAVDEEMLERLLQLEQTATASLGSVTRPLLVSVRSGAKFSMPGMMDTILNLGLNDATVVSLGRQTGNDRFAFDSYRRFIQMFGNVVLEIPREHFEVELEAIKDDYGVTLDTEIGEGALRVLVEKYKKLVLLKTGTEFPEEPLEQLRLARDAVFRSWNNPRAIEYRRIYDIPNEIGTAVNVQMMVFGNTGDRSATGVGFTRNPATGEKEFYGEFLVNAQGEDVVAGIRTPQPIRELERLMPAAYRELRRITSRLERHYKDVQDFEFTIQDEQLFMLQTRNGKRTGYAAIRIATDLVNERLVNMEEALQMIDAGALSQLLAPIFDPDAWAQIPVAALGLPASPGAASGQLVFTAEDAVRWAGKGLRVVLVRKETVPDDIHGMYVAEGVLTATGGMTSHAAVVGRQMGKPSVVGASAVQVDQATKQLTMGDHVLREGDPISLDGLTGEVKLGEVASQPSEILRVVTGALKPTNSDIYQRFSRVMKWADRVRRLDVRANADQPDQARVAYEFGARGIGLCRTEHMFFGEGRIPIVQRMILAETEADRRKALKELLPLQREDFYGVFKAMRGEPVTIRTIDPPLHEFLPKREELMVEIAKLEATNSRSPARAEKRALLDRVEQLHEFNPMLGHRGVRLGITYPEITEMQTRAIIEAAVQLAREGMTVIPEIMIPLVSDVRELRDQKAVVDRVAKMVMDEQGVTVSYQVGTMIEVPRAAVTADAIAEVADFFSFGTNDLTQMVFGFSRDDSTKFIKEYQALKILERDPFASLDVTGVGALVEMGVRLGRKSKPGMKLGVCGEHGGDPASIRFFDRVGLDYVSASPYRVPIARLAAAQAALEAESGDSKTDN